jgi:FkbM family methyltransferase
MRFIDCGSFDGDTLKELKNHYGSIESIAAFEPDPANFLKLFKLVKSNGPFAERTMLYPCGVWSHTKQLQFSSEKTESSHISKEGENHVQCIALDDALHGFEPTLIKMDIEGAEYEALLGAREMISDDKPGLAISVYHRPEHLWQIPLLINQWGLGYKLHLRAYGYAGFDIVMYALPE